IEELQKLVRDNPDQQAKVRKVAAQTERLLVWQDKTIQLVRAGNREAAVARTRMLDGKRLMDEVRVFLDDFLTEEERLNGVRTADLERSGTAQTWALVGGGVLALVSASALLWLFTRGIARRLAVLTDNARRLAAGKELAAPLIGRDEIGRLDHVFHDMAEA